MNQDKKQPMPLPRRGGPMGGGGHMIQPGEKAKDFKGTIKKLGRYLVPYRWSIVAVTAFAIISTVFSIVSPKILGGATNQIVDDYVSIQAYNQVTASLPKGVKLPAGTTGAQLLKKMPPAIVSKIPADQIDVLKTTDLSKRPTFHFSAIWSIIILLLVLYMVSAVFSYLQGWIMSSVTQKVSYTLRKDISLKINRLPLSYFDSTTYGQVLSRVTNDVDTVSQTLNQSLSQILTSIVMIIGITVMMLSISPLLTLIVVLIVPLSFIMILAITKKSQTQFIRQQNELGNINGHIEEMYAGHMIMRVFNGETRSVQAFTAINERLYRSAWKSQFMSGLMYPITNFVGNLGYVAVAVVGGWQAINGNMKIGDIQAFFQYVQQFNQPIAQTANIANVLQSTAASAERVFQFLEEPEQAPDVKNPVRLPRVEGNIELKNVVFGYDKKKPVIHNFSATIRPGSRVAIVGPTGAGKTTIVNLLMRFYEIDGGSITIDGVDIRDMERKYVRTLFGMVLQDTWLFNGTLHDNIAYGNPDASMKDIVQAAKNAHADHFIRALPQGYDMEINEDATNISQGEKQLVTIARAMLAKTPMLILDEATSSVDTRTELLIQKAMDNLMKDKTSFVIAHRLSTIRDADLILVVNEGNVVEQGTHHELLAQNGFYAALYNSQFAITT